MKPTPIYEIKRRIQVLAPKHQAAHLRGLIASEKHGTRRAKLEQALDEVQERRA